MKPPLNKIDIKTSDNNIYFTVLDGVSAKTITTKKKIHGSLKPIS